MYSLADVGWDTALIVTACKGWLLSLRANARSCTETALTLGPPCADMNLCLFSPLSYLCCISLSSSSLSVASQLPPALSSLELYSPTQTVCVCGDFYLPVYHLVSVFLPLVLLCWWLFHAKIKPRLGDSQYLMDPLSLLLLNGTGRFTFKYSWYCFETCCEAGVLEKDRSASA